MFARVTSMGLLGLNAFSVTVEADVASGLPGFDLVGLPDAAVKESRDRVRAALKNCGFEFPVSRVTINLAPADIRKEGPIYDLPVLAALLLATRQAAFDPAGLAFIGELSLTGDVRPVSGALPMVIAAREAGVSDVFIPEANAAEGSVVEGINVYPIPHIAALVDHLTGGTPLSPCEPGQFEAPALPDPPDFADVRGQHDARRALEIAAAGGHNALLIGPPGAGKSMLAKRLPSILPAMTFEEQLNITQIHSIAGCLPPGLPLIRERPFRDPHHTVSPAALVGGGSVPRPGELSLAHNGVLFLDELPEFSRPALEVLRQPLEDGTVSIARVSGTLSYPCSVMLVCAMNPCPCGYYGHPTRPCTCTPRASSAYLARVSGPLLDRLDLHIEVPPVDFQSLDAKEAGEPSAAIRQRVNAARTVQQARYGGSPVTCNARLTPALVREACPLTDPARTLLRRAFDTLGLSARAYDRVLKVARTIADLAGADAIDTPHAAEAIQYRSLDRKYWQR